MLISKCVHGQLSIVSVAQVQQACLLIKLVIFIITFHIVYLFHNIVISYDYSCANFNVVAYVISVSAQHQLQCVYCSGCQPVGRDPTWNRHRFSLKSPLVVTHFTKSMHNCTSIMYALVSVRNCPLSPTRKTTRPTRGKISPTRGTIRPTR